MHNASRITYYVLRLMKILLIIPPSPDHRQIVRMIDCSHESKANYLWQPNDFIIITSLLKPRDEVVLIDGTADALSDEEFFRVCQQAQGDIIFFALSSVCWKSDYEFFERSKTFFQDIPIYVIGDIFVERDYQQMMLKECDGIVFQPYLLNLEKMIERKPPLPGVYTEISDPDISERAKQITLVNSSVPHHEIFLKPGYRFPFAKHFKFATVTAMWGCPFTCSYCTNSKFPPAVRRYSDILRELEYLKKLGIKELFFADKVFGYPYSNSIPLLEEMSQRFRFSWTCYFHPQLYKAKLLDLMHAAGCHTIITGIDSLNLPSLQQYHRTVEQEKLDALLTHANRLKMSVCADFIIGLEHETEEDIIQTLEGAIKLPIDFASFNIATPLPGSSIRAKARKEGKLQFGQDGFDTYGRDDVLGNENVTGERIKQLRRKAILKFYLRPSYLLKRLRKTSSLGHFLIQCLEMFFVFSEGIK